VSVYYNEFDPFAAEWLRTLILFGHIAPGDVDERSIVDVKPDDLRGYTQHHFFAGIGVWSHSLRSAGWADDRPVWTGSCPCQPFSAAGKGGGFDDERHLWPAFFNLIRECRPDVVLGEQVASKDGLGWLDLVYADLEGADYSVGAVDTCAAGFGAPHIRQRLYWTALADADDARLEGRLTERQRAGERAVGPGGLAGRLADADGRDASAEREQRGGQQRQQPQDGRTGLVADAEGHGHERRGQLDQSTGRDGAAHGGDVDRPGPTNGLWRDADWLGCRDGKWRPVKSLFQSLANGSTFGVGSVRGVDLEALTKEVVDACGRETDPREALLDLWSALPTESLGGWPFGGSNGLSQAPVLFAFLRQLAQQGWPLAQSLPCASAEASNTELRELWFGAAAACASRQRGLDGQQSAEPSNAVRLLSPVLARHAQAAWGEALVADAADRFPLAKGAVNRVGRLRGYGNAIVAPQAQAFVEAVMSAL
jgi:site-specific DNA-cytosine methylase